MVSAAVWAGVNSLLDNYIGTQSDDKVVLVYTSETYKYAVWLSVALEMRGVVATKAWMIPLHDAEFRDRFRAALPDPGSLSGRIVIVTLELDTLSHDNIIRGELRRYDVNKVLAIRVISACESLFSDALSITADNISARNTTVLERCMGATNLRLTTAGGSELQVKLDSTKHRWISNRGVWRPGNFVILPPGEVATFPAAIEGVFVADFAFNVNMITDRDARLDRYPVKVWIENNRAVKYECEDAEIAGFLDQCFYTHCAHIVGELGLGTNIGITEPIALNSHINERHPGIHLGFGQSNQSPETVGYTCDIHLDLIARGGIIWVDDIPEPLNLQNVVPSELPHPSRTHDEDARSAEIYDLDVDDCCGILTSDGIKLFSLPTSLGTHQ